MKWLVFWFCLAAPYLAILRELHTGHAERGIRAGVGFAGAAFLLVGALGPLTFAYGGPSWVRWWRLVHDPLSQGILLGAVAFIVVQALLFWNARRLSKMLPPPTGKIGSFGWGVFLGCYFIVLYALALPGLHGKWYAVVRNDGYVQHQLRTLVVAATTYSSTYRNGYPPSMDRLAPPPPGSHAHCRAADLIDTALASGRKAGYIFEYHTGSPAVQANPECPAGVNSFTITAHPIEYGESGIRSFLTDEAGVIRWTAEDRAATKEDPPLRVE